MRQLRAIGFGLLAALITGGLAFAVTSGGFPSRPVFQSIRLGAAASYPWQGPAIDFPNGGAVWNFTNAGVYLTSNLYFDGTNWRYKVTGAGARLQMLSNSVAYSSAPTGTAGTVATLSASQPMANSLFAEGGFATGSCSIVSNGNGFTSCTHVAVGDNKFNFTSTQTNPPYCVASLYGTATVGHVQIFNTTTSLVEVLEFNSSNAAADVGAVNLVCLHT